MPVAELEATRKAAVVLAAMLVPVLGNMSASVEEVLVVVEPAAAAAAEIVTEVTLAAAVAIVNVAEGVAVAAVGVGAAVHVAEVSRDLEQVEWAAVIVLTTAAEMTAAVVVAAEMQRVAHKVVVAGMPVEHMTEAFQHFADSNPAVVLVVASLAPPSDLELTRSLGGDHSWVPWENCLELLWDPWSHHIH